MTSLTLTLDPVVQLTREQFYELCKVNHDIRLERSSTGDLILMPPTGWESGKSVPIKYLSRVLRQQTQWAEFASLEGMFF